MYGRDIFRATPILGKITLYSLVSVSLVSVSNIEVTGSTYSMDLKIERNADKHTSCGRRYVDRTLFIHWVIFPS